MDSTLNLAPISVMSRILFVPAVAPSLRSAGWPFASEPAVTRFDSLPCAFGDLPEKAIILLPRVMTAFRDSNAAPDLLCSPVHAAAASIE
jgi:hypothetical protein